MGPFHVHAQLPVQLADSHHARATLGYTFHIWLYMCSDDANPFPQSWTSAFPLSHLSSLLPLYDCVARLTHLLGSASWSM